MYTDASYGGEQAKSQAGIIMMLNNLPVLLYSRKQDSVSLSTTEAEYVAACEGAKDASWIRQLSTEMNLITALPTLYTDNNAASKLTKSNRYQPHIRHIDHK